MRVEVAPIGPAVVVVVHLVERTGQLVDELLVLRAIPHVVPSVSGHRGGPDRLDAFRAGGDRTWLDLLIDPEIVQAQAGDVRHPEAHFHVPQVVAVPGVEEHGREQ